MVRVWRILAAVVAICVVSAMLPIGCAPNGDKTITLEDGASIHVPQGAVGRYATVSAAKLDPEDGPEVPEGFTIETLYEFSVDEPLAEPVTLRLPLGIVADDSVLWLAKYSEAEGEWHGVGFTTEDGYAVVETDSLSLFGTIRASWSDFTNWAAETAGSAGWWAREILPYLTVGRYISFLEGFMGADEMLCEPPYSTSAELECDDTGSRGLISASAVVVGDDYIDVRIQNQTKMYLHVYFDGPTVAPKAGAFLSLEDLVTVLELSNPVTQWLLSESFTSDSVVLLPECTSDFRVHMSAEQVLQIRTGSSDASALLNGLDPAFALVPVVDSELFTALRDVGLASDEFYSALEDYQDEWITKTYYFLGIMERTAHLGYVFARNLTKDVLGYLLGGIPKVAEILDNSAERVEEIWNKGGDADLGGTIVVSYRDGEEEPDRFTLTVSSTTGGTATTPGEGAFNYDSAKVVDLVATPDSGYQFVNWTGDVATIADVNSASTTITINDNYSITANFEEVSVTQYTLTISSSSGGSVTTPGEGTFTRDTGTVVSLVATPASGYKFVNWTGNVGTIANVNAASTTITMNGNYSITANFEEVGQDEVYFPDPNLEAAIRNAIRKPEGPIYPSDLDGLTSLSARMWNITDLTGLEYCTGLTDLDLRYNQISDISPLASLTSLESLALCYWNQISDISPLAGLTSLTVLGLSSNRISDISPLATLTGLISLRISGNRIGDISPLANLASLTGLVLDHNEISDVSPLAGLTSLTSLQVSYNDLGDVSPLSGLTNLWWLHIHNNRISDISPLAGLSNLTACGLGSNQISDISPLAGLSNLTACGLGSNQISDISPLAGLTSLTTIWLESNQISDISPLANLTSLTTLYLDQNQISDISPLAGLTKLRYMVLSSNQISDISPLVENQGVDDGDFVDLRWNPLSDESINEHIPALRARGVNVYY